MSQYQSRVWLSLSGTNSCFNKGTGFPPIIGGPIPPKIGGQPPVKPYPDDPDYPPYEDADSDPCEYEDGIPALTIAGNGDSCLVSSGFFVGGSLIDTIALNYHYIAKDYKLGRGSSSCKTCQSGVGSGASLFEFYLERRHRYRDMTTYSGFGPGVFSGYDTKLSVYEFDSGIVADLFEARDIAPRRFVDGLEGDTKDGILYNLFNKRFKDLRLYDSTDTLTSSLSSAEKAVLTLHNGVTFTFDLVQTESFSGVVGGQSVGPLFNPDALLDTEYIAHWEFDENAGTTAGDSEGTYDGTISGPTWVASTAPSGGSALSFAGATTVQFPLR
ncbi:MAG: hypothetical protein AAGB26_15075 [Planctomycetota bacterium]